MKNDGWNKNRLLVDYFCVWRLIGFRICVGTYNIVAHTFVVGCLRLTGIIILQSMTSSSPFSNSLVCYILWVYFIADKSIDRFVMQQRLLHTTCWPAAAYRWEWRRREVHCNSNFSLPPGLSCWTFRGDGLFSCLVCVICTDTRVSIPSFGGFSLLLSVLVGAHKSVISASGNFELNSFHLGQDCPQSFKLNSFHLG